MKCGRCGKEIVNPLKRCYVAQGDGVVEIHVECKHGDTNLPNVFRELGFPDAKRDRSQPGYVWY